MLLCVAAVRVSWRYRIIRLGMWLARQLQMHRQVLVCERRGCGKVSPEGGLQHQHQHSSSLQLSGRLGCAASSCWRLCMQHFQVSSMRLPIY